MTPGWPINVSTRRKPTPFLQPKQSNTNTTHAPFRYLPATIFTLRQSRVHKSWRTKFCTAAPNSSSKITVFFFVTHKNVLHIDSRAPNKKGQTTGSKDTPELWVLSTERTSCHSSGEKNLWGWFLECLKRKMCTPALHQLHAGTQDSVSDANSLQVPVLAPDFHHFLPCHGGFH